MTRFKRQGKMGPTYREDREASIEFQRHNLGRLFRKGDACSVEGCGEPAEPMGENPGPWAKPLCAGHHEDMNEAMGQLHHRTRPEGEP